MRAAAFIQGVDEHLTERARVDEAKLGAVVKIDDDVRVLREFVMWLGNAELSAHAQVHHERVVVVEINDQELSVATNVSQPPTAQGGDEVGVRLTAHGAITGDGHGPHNPPSEKGFEVSSDRFDLG